MALFLSAIVVLAAVEAIGAPRSAGAVDITGQYTGTATLTAGISVALSVTLSQNGTTVSGTLNVRGFDCLSSLGFSGTVSGTTLSGSFTGASTIGISGTVVGNQLSGTFDISVAPCATTGSGPFTLTKVTPTATRTTTAPATAATPTPEPQAAAPDCGGDCNGNDEVTVDELITGVNIALGNTALSACAVFDPNGDTEVTVNELIIAVNNALTGCPPPGLASEVESNTQTVRKADEFMRRTTADDAVDQRMSDTLAFVQAQPGVAGVSLFPDGLTLLIAHTNGLESALMLMPDFVEDPSTAATAIALTRPWSTGAAAGENDVPTNAVLVQGRDLTDKLRNDHYPQLESTLRGMGFGLGRPDQGVVGLGEGAYTTDFFRTQLGKYQIIYIIGHGANDGTKSVLATGKLGPPGASFPSPAGSDAADVDKKRLLTALTSPGLLTRFARWTGYDTAPTPRYLVTSAFIANYYQSDARLARDSLVYLDGCNLLADLPRALADAGAAAVVYFAGNTVDTETTLVGTPPIDRRFFAALAQGKSVDEAIDVAKANASQVTLSVYPPDGGKLRFIPLTSADFSPSCESPAVGQEVTFTQDTVVPDNAQIAKWVWDFGDRSPPEDSKFLPASSTNDIKHAYKTATEDEQKPGYSTPFTVTLTTTDLFGHQVKTQKSLRLITRTQRLAGGLGAAGCPIPPPPPSDQIRIKVITTYSDDPNTLFADPLYNVHVLIGSTNVEIGSDDDVARTTVSAGTYVLKFPKDNGLDDQNGKHLYRVGSVNLHVTKDGGSGIRCAPNSQEGDVRATFDASASNPSALSEYEVALRIVPYDAPALQNGATCN